MGDLIRMSTSLGTDAMETWIFMVQKLSAVPSHLLFKDHVKLYSDIPPWLLLILCLQSLCVFLVHLLRVTVPVEAMGHTVKWSSHRSLCLEDQDLCWHWFNQRREFPFFLPVSTGPKEDLNSLYSRHQKSSFKRKKKMWITVKEVTAVCHLMKLNACVNVYRLQAELNFFGSKTSAT